jgi:hypothetical protein
LKQNKKKYLILSSISGIILIGGIGSYYLVNTDYQYQLHHETIEYRLEIYPDSNETVTVFVPMSKNKEVQNNISILSGNGTFSQINSSYGAALQINFSGEIKIYGKYGTTQGISSYQLTMIHQTSKEKNMSYWMYYHSDNSSENPCQFDLTLHYTALDIWETYEISGFFSEGWNTYQCDHYIAS